MTTTRPTEQPTRSGPRIRLRPWRPDDAPAVTAACQDPEIQRWTQVPVPYRSADAEGFVTGIAMETWAEGGALFAVVGADDTVVGSIGLFPPQDGVGELGYWTAPEHRGQGLTAEALGVLADWALDVLGLRRVELTADVRNAASCRTAERAGFVREGVLRRRSLHRGDAVDDVMYSLLPDDPRR